MIWVYALIGLAVGLIIGALAVRLGSSKFREQEAMKRDTEKQGRTGRVPQRAGQPLCPQCRTAG